ncbi:protein TAPT1 isoform X1 [Biomphalaria pfeifferi]|uniref:Protein TAPT1 isoform X1 n=1 Tax=Biomphalaria pfeifferi TaxID=112525 RepID=A0AAD8BQ94_BIOPF|nr:protein TAPT1 isoform X1 [Biomphalaria pfeifferi]
MSSLAFVTHPSVRIKGTENSYTPSQCLDDRCPVKAPHLHCPFCVKTDAYQDPVILKAHYRVKHVDKGIEFAGLKILRCCDQCDIIGIIKGEKRFKGAHWHCYRCRNGFNRRDEAIKHYKTHFRNPQTTFQIQITQDLNSPPEVRPHEDHNTSSQDAFASIENPVQEIIHPTLAQSAINLAEQNILLTGSSANRHSAVQKIKVKHDAAKKGDNCGGREDEETIMIIQGDQLDSAFASHIIHPSELSALSKTAVDSNLSWEIRFRLEEEEKNMYKAKMEEYKAQVELLQQQVSDLEAQLTQQSQLKLQDLIESLSAGEAGKQGLSQQLAKFLEQCQAQPSQDNSSELHHQIVKTEPDHSLSDTSDHSLNDQLVDPASDAHESGAVSHLNEIPEGFQVLCTTVDGHVVVTRNPNTVSGVTRRTLLSDTRNAAVVSTSGLPDSGQTLFSHILGAQGKDQTSGTLSISDATVTATSLIADLSHDDHGELGILGSGHSCQMEVVTAADGLAALGTGVSSLSNNAEDNGGQGGFVMDIENGARIYVQASESLQVEQSLEEHFESKEPESKRARVT